MIASKIWAAVAKTASSAVPHLKAVAAGTKYPEKKKKLVPGTAYKIAKPAAKAASKLKNMAASCQACAGK